MKKLTKAELRTLEELATRAEQQDLDIPGWLSQKYLQRTEQPVPPTPDAIKSVLNQRGERYGDFTDHAQIAQDLQDVLRGVLTSITSQSHTVYTNLKAREGWHRLSMVQRQALTVLCDKFARIISGDPNYDDNWVDIQGYARLVHERLPATNTAPE